MGTNVLMDEIQQRVGKNAVQFRVVVQLAEAGDMTDDATVRWPETRQQIPFGDITLDSLATNNAAEPQRIIFDPIPRVEGIDASADPLFEPRANLYLMSGRRRRSAEKAEQPDTLVGLRSKECLIRLEDIRIASGPPTRMNVTHPPSTRVQRAVT